MPQPREYYFHAAVLNDCIEDKKTGRLILPPGLYQIQHPLQGNFVATRETFQPSDRSHWLRINGSLNLELGGSVEMGVIEDIQATTIRVFGSSNRDDGWAVIKEIDASWMHMENAKIKCEELNIKRWLGIHTNARLKCGTRAAVSTATFIKAKNTGGHARDKTDPVTDVCLQLARGAEYDIGLCKFAVNSSKGRVTKPFVSVGGVPGLVGVYNEDLGKSDEVYQSPNCFIYRMEGVGDGQAITCIVTAAGPRFCFTRLHSVDSREVIEGVGRSLGALYDRKAEQGCSGSRWAEYAIILNFVVQMENVFWEFAKTNAMRARSNRNIQLATEMLTGYASELTRRRASMFKKGS